MRLVITVLRPVALWLSRWFFKIQFNGVEHIPPSGACIVTPNHLTYADPIWITIPIYRRVRYMAWARMFEIPGLGLIMRSFGAFPVKLESTDKYAQREAIELLKRGDALVIFPEGGRSKNGKLMPFKAGAFRLAITHGIPILPVTIHEGAYEIWPVHQTFPRSGELTITFHPPIAVEPLTEELNKLEIKQRARELANRTRAVVASVLDDATVEEERLLIGGNDVEPVMKQDTPSPF
ncbi:MAG: lysophospholipid acyltransferase family protein [Acidobacteriota bacterium]